jgi:hypothetical protein
MRTSAAEVAALPVRCCGVHSFFYTIYILSSLIYNTSPGVPSGNIRNFAQFSVARSNRSPLDAQQLQIWIDMFKWQIGSVKVTVRQLHVQGEL